MTEDISRHARIVSASLHERLHRHKLVFVQHGAVFDGLTQAVIAEGDPLVLEPQDVAPQQDRERVYVVGLERYTTSPGASPSMGALRHTVSDLLEAGVEVCLWSTAPKLAFTPVPGSSLIDDASPFYMELLPVRSDNPESTYPAIRMGASLEATYRLALGQLGVGVLASLDRALYDAQLDRDAMFEMLDPREIEALRGAGLAVCCEGDPYQLSAPDRFGELRDQLASALAAQVQPQSELSSISEELWVIERTIRLALRNAAVDKFGPKWRSSVLHGDLNGKVLDRAMVDGFVAAKSVKEIRDPIEWLSLGELVEVVTSSRFENLGLLPIFWSKFSQDILPIRNRLSHMRNFKHGDRGVVRMWVSQVERMLG